LPLNEKSDSELFRSCLVLRLPVGDPEETQPLKNLRP